MTPEEIVSELSEMNVADIAFVFGGAGQLLAMHCKLTEAELYYDFAIRAHGDPDCHIRLDKPHRRPKGGPFTQTE